jgi:hypothetical protein
MSARVAAVVRWVHQPLKRVPSALVWTLLLATTTYPVLVAVANNALDSAWVLGLDLGHAQHLHWGVDTLFTYGPYGFLDIPFYYLPRTWLFALVAQLGVHLLFVGSIGLFLWRSRAPRWVWPVAVALAVLASANASLDTKAVLAGTFLLALVVTHRLGRRTQVAAAVTAGVVLAVVSLVKATAMVVAVPILVLAFVLVLRNRPARRSVAVGAASYGVAVCGLWLLAHQGLSNVVPYLRGSAQVSGGYSSAMSIYSADGITLLGALIVACIALLILEGWRGQLPNLARTALLLLPLAAVNFKEGFVRYDSHDLIFFANLALIGGLLLAEIARHALNLRAALRRALLVGTVSVASAVVLWSSGMQALQSRWEGLGSQWSTTTSLLVHPSERPGMAEQSKAYFRSATPVPTGLLDIIGSHPVDVMPWDIGVVFAYGLTWAPRPVLQSYSAYTPYLDNLDAAYFASDKRPDYILYRFEAIDGRYPMFEEPHAMRAIAANYSARSVDADWLLFERRQAPSPVAATADQGRVCAPFGQAIPVPHLVSGQLYARISVPYSLLGRVAELIFKPGEVRIQFATDAGPSPPYRFIQAVGEDGLPLSGHVLNVQEMSDLLGGKVDHQIQTLTVTAQWHREYAQEVCASFYSTQA